MSMHRIPTTVLTGFLGAGKTTLLNKMLMARQGEKTAVIVNEFGDIGIDGQLVIGAEEEILELNNGCICCTVRGDLARAVERLIARTDRIDRIVIETTGLADPAPVIQSFILDETLRLNTELDAIVTVVDARHILEQISNEQAREQIAFADVIVLNKVDLATGPGFSLDTLVRKLMLLNPTAKIHRTIHCDVDPRYVSDIHAFDLRNVLKLEPTLLEDSAHEHDEDIQHTSIRELGEINEALFMRWLNNLVQEQGKDLLRIKGIIDLAGEPRRFVFHGVHMTSTVALGSHGGRGRPA